TRLVSDWSSDVCSSDLPRPSTCPRESRIELREAERPEESQRRCEREQVEGLGAGPEGVVQDAAGERAEQDGRHQEQQREGDAREIGRASCREREEERGG